MTEERTVFKKEYKKQFFKGVIATVILLILAAVVFIFSLSISQYPIGFGEAYRILIDNITGNANPISYAERTKNQIVMEMNLPIAIGGLAVGAVLAVGGAVMQNIVKNPLADPYTTGISSGAYFGVTIYVVLGISVLPLTYGSTAQIINAFVFALIPASAIIIMSTFKKTSSTMMVLIGIGVMYMFSASSTMLKVIASPEALSEIYVWGVGSIGKITWDNIPLLIGATVVILVVMMFLSAKINILASDDKMSTALGVNPYRSRLLLLVIISITTAVAVCFTGTIGFVGLVAPHIARMLVGSNARYLIPCSAAVGAFMLLAADCIARNIGPAGLPVGVITALIGSPIFLYFLIRQKKSAWRP